MNKIKLSALCLVLAGSGALAGCDTMSRQDRNTAIGAGIGAASGAALGGGTAGVIGGAAVGGLVGREVGRNR